MFLDILNVDPWVLCAFSVWKNSIVSWMPMITFKGETEHTWLSHEKVKIILCEEFPLYSYPFPGYYMFTKLDFMAFSYFVATLNFPTSEVLPEILFGVTFTAI